MKNIFRTLIIFFIVGLAMVPGLKAQQDKRLAASVQKTNVNMGEMIYLTLTAVNIVPPGPPSIPSMDYFDVNFIGQSSRIEIINFERTQSILYQYELMPKRSGVFQIPPITTVVDGITYRTNPINITISQSTTSAPMTDSGDDIALEILLSAKKCYVGQPVVVELKWYLRKDITSYSLEIPFLPTFKNFMIKDIEPDPAKGNYDKIQYNNQVIEYVEKSNELYQGRSYVTLTLRKIFIPASSGTFTFDSANLRCDVVKGYQRSRDPFDDFGFGRLFSSNQPVVERRGISSNSVDLTVESLPPPPQGFSRNVSVGDFAMTIGANPKEVKVGDPITLTIVVKGTGNIEGLSEPQLTDTKDFRVFNEDAKTDIKVTEQGITGEKVFQTLLIPTSDRVKFIPPLRLEFFNPQTGQFRSILSDQIPVTVIPKPVSQEPVIVGASADNASSRDIQIIYRDLPGTIKLNAGNPVTGGKFYFDSIWFKGLFVFAFMFNVLFGVYMRRERRLRSDTGLRRKTFAYKFASKFVREAEVSLKKGNVNEYYLNLVKAVNEYVADKLNVPSAGLTGDTVKDMLEAKNVEPGLIGRIIDFYRKADMARFMPSKHNIDSARDISEVKDLISRLEKTKW